MSVKHKVYHGEYSLKHWIKLILTQNIKLPAYQRYYVWTPEQAKHLIRAIKDYNYLPAVTIGCCCDPQTGKKENMLLDGQQRLTTVLLAWIGKFPKRKQHTKTYADENDGHNDEDENSLSEWTFRELVKAGDDKDFIIKDINTNHATGYDDFPETNVKVDDSFLEKHFIQFSYIVLDNTSKGEESKFFTNIFHSINKEGTKLTAQESRAALYYQYGDQSKLLEPEFCKTIVVNKSQMDFVRLLALVCNYTKVGKTKMASGFKTVKERENLYENFVREFVVEKDFSESDLFSLDKTSYKERLDNFTILIEQLSLKNKEFSTIIEHDYYMFGIVYHIFIKGDSLSTEKWHEVDGFIKAELHTLDEKYKQNPGQLSRLKDRLEKSIQYYQYMVIVR